MADITLPTTGMKPCPFCGAALLVNDDVSDLYVRRYGAHYEHPDNGCWLSGDEVRPSEVESWNTRTDGVAPTALALPRRGLVVLKNVIQLLREEACFMDEEGDDTNALEELLEALCADGVNEADDLPVKWIGADGTSHEISLDYAAQIAKWIFDKHGDVPQVDEVIAGVALPATGWKADKLGSSLAWPADTSTDADGVGGRVERWPVSQDPLTQLQVAAVIHKRDEDASGVGVVRHETFCTDESKPK